MYRVFLKTSLIATLLTAVSLSTYADTQANEAFKSGCIKAWMERSDKVSDQVGFKNFGEKYCNCATTKSLNSDDEITKAAKLCLSQTLLHDTMDSLEEDPGLKNLTQDKIESHCSSEWEVIYPQISDDVKQKFKLFCQCAAPKLMDLNKDRDTVTDTEWAKKIDSIAEDCSGNVAIGKEIKENNQG